MFTIKMNTKQKIIESFEGKRTEMVWELIEKAIKEIYKKEEEANLEKAKEEYLKFEKEINSPEFRYLIVEQYNIDSGFFGKFYEDNINLKGGIPFKPMFEDYFKDDEGGFEEVLLVDMKEKKCYLIDKNVSYPVQKLKIK